MMPIDLDPQARDESTVALLGRLAFVDELCVLSAEAYRYNLGLLGGDGHMQALGCMEIASAANQRYLQEFEEITAELMRRRCRVTMDDLPDGNLALNAAVLEWIGA